MENKKNLIVVVLIVLVILAGGYFLMGKRYTVENPRVVQPQNSSNLSTKPEEGVKEFSIVARKWKFEPSVIKVKVGDKVRLRVKSIDVDHGFLLPDFKVNMTLQPNRLLTTEFVANRKGEFVFSCSVYCGSGHGDMKGTLIVE